SPSKSALVMRISGMPVTMAGSSDSGSAPLTMVMSARGSWRKQPVTASKNGKAQYVSVSQDRQTCRASAADFGFRTRARGDRFIAGYFCGAVAAFEVFAVEGTSRIIRLLLPGTAGVGVGVVARAGGACCGGGVGMAAPCSRLRRNSVDRL